MTKNKAPGPDSLTNEFYKILGSKLEETLTGVFNSFLNGGELTLYFIESFAQTEIQNFWGHIDQYLYLTLITNYIQKYWQKDSR